MFRLQLHDRPYDRVAYMVDTLMMPGTRHLMFVSLPARWSFLYLFLAPVHDYVVLPLYRLYRRCMAFVRPSSRASGLKR
jgi:hypothetical protein